MSNLVIVAGAVFEISCWKTDRHTDKRRRKTVPPRLPFGAGK